MINAIRPNSLMRGRWWLVIIAIVFLGGASWLIINRQEQPRVCADDVKICSDLSQVRRQLPTCDFTPCPVYDRATRTGEGCVITGCSGQICSDQEEITTCEYKPEYGCYQRTKCERQVDGKCGWTPGPSLPGCIDQARQGLLKPS